MKAAWQSVRIDGGKLDFLNLRGAKLTDVLITDCIINELDLGSAAGTQGGAEELHHRDAGPHRAPG